jgi:hypothetical protein
VGFLIFFKANQNKNFGCKNISTMRTPKGCHDGDIKKQGLQTPNDERNNKNPIDKG